MKTEELETQLRDVLRERAERITESDLLGVSADRSPVAPLSPRKASPRWHGFAAAAVIAVVVGLVAAGLAARNEPQAEQVDQIADEPGTGLPASAAAAPRGWPLTNDEPLPATANAEELRSPESAARAYLSQVVGLPPDWPMENAQVEEDRAAVRYVLQDVEAAILLARDPNGFWYVASADTEFIRPGVPTSVSSPSEVSVAAGPRMYATGARVRVSALAADGRLLTSETTRVKPRGEGEAGVAAVVRLEWSGREMAAVYRADVLDDHDDDPATPEATVGHWSTGMPGSGLSGLPPNIEVATADGVFSEVGAVEEVAEAYMRSRFPDYPAPGIDLDLWATRASLGYVTWMTGDGGESHSGGIILLRQSGDEWSVIAAVTHDVDASSLRVADSRVRGRITTTNRNSLFADVFQPDGTPAAGSPRPEGQPDAAYRFGTAGGSDDGSLDIDVPVEPGSAVVRVNLVGGTILSITEFRMSVPPPAG